MEYPVIIGPLSEEDGGGYMGYAPDLIGCMSDGETPEEAISNTYDAIAEWLDAARQRGIPVPLPGSASARERLDKEQLVKTLRSVTADAGLIDERL